MKTKLSGLLAYTCPHQWERKEITTLWLNAGTNMERDLSQQKIGERLVIRCVHCGEERII